MSNKPPLSDFLHALPAILQAISHRVLRALVALALRVASIARSIAAAISNLIVRAGTFVWHLYCRLELSIVEALAGVMLILWSLRLFALFLAPAVILAWFRYWIAAAIYVAVLALAIWRFYSAKAEDVERAAEDQAPVRALLTRVLRWAVRALLALASLIWVATYLSSSSDIAVSVLSEKWDRAVRDLSSSYSSGRDTYRQPTTAPGRSTKTQSRSSSASVVSPTYGPIAHPPVARVAVTRPSTMDVEGVFAANQASIFRTLSLARTGQSGEVEISAKAAARAYDFAPFFTSVSRDRKAARPLNDEARTAFAALGADSDPTRYRPLVEIQRRAFAADPTDIEIASNLAIYLLRAGDSISAHKYTVYALSLPRSSESTGRTADWTTLAATLASRGDQDGAANALFVTLAISTDVKKRCEVAVHATRKTYGPVLRSATEAMFQRVRERQLSDALECGLPIVW